jgi:molybdenum cofactor guanylyltransferase
VSTPEFDTVILAGGQASRMGGADKPALLVSGEPMIVSVARASAAAGARQLIVVGPRRDGPVLDALAAVADGAGAALRFAREQPPGGGPVAALRAGLPAVTAPWLLLLAADLPFLRNAELAGLLGHAQAAERAGAVLADADGRPQWLAGGWQAEMLLAALRGYDGSSLHGLLTPLDPVLLQVAGAVAELEPWLDCDTPAELTAARRLWRLRGAEAGGTEARGAERSHIEANGET